MAEHPIAGRVRDALEAFSRGDFETLGSFLAEDVVWHVGGNHELSGDYRGRNAALAYCAEAFALAGGTLHGEPFEITQEEFHRENLLQIHHEDDGDAAGTERAVA